MAPSTLQSSGDPAAAKLSALLNRWLLLGAHGPRARFHMAAAMLVSTIPVGGHHLLDLVVGGMIAACAIFFVRLSLGVRHDRLATSGDVGLASA